MWTTSASRCLRVHACCLGRATATSSGAQGSETGFAIAYEQDAAWANTSGVKVDVSTFSRLDGFSPSSQILTLFDEPVDTDGTAFWDSIELSMDEITRPSSSTSRRASACRTGLRRTRGRPIPTRPSSSSDPRFASSRIGATGSPSVDSGVSGERCHRRQPSSRCAMTDRWTRPCRA